MSDPELEERDESGWEMSQHVAVTVDGAEVEYLGKSTDSESKRVAFAAEKNIIIALDNRYNCLPDGRDRKMMQRDPCFLIYFLFFNWLFDLGGQSLITQARIPGFPVQTISPAEHGKETPAVCYRMPSSTKPCKAGLSCSHTVRGTTNMTAGKEFNACMFCVFHMKSMLGATAKRHRLILMPTATLSVTHHGACGISRGEGLFDTDLGKNIFNTLGSVTPTQPWPSGSRDFVLWVLFKATSYSKLALVPLTPRYFTKTLPTFQPSSSLVLRSAPFHFSVALSSNFKTKSTKMFDPSLLIGFGDSNSIESALLNVDDFFYDTPSPPVTLILVLKVVGPVDVSAEKLAKYLKPRWALRGPATFTKIAKAKNLFTVEFGATEDYDRVLVFGPYHYRLRAIFLSRFNALHAPLHHYPFEMVVWIQADGLPRGLRHFAVARRIGNFVGRFLAYDSSEETRFQGILRFKIRINGFLALPRGVTLLTRFQKFVTTFTYEKLPIYCYRCGHLDHTLVECHKELDHPHDPEPFSLTLRAGSFGIWFMHDRARVEIMNTPTIENPDPSMDGIHFPDMANNGHQIPPQKIPKRSAFFTSNLAPTETDREGFLHSRSNQSNIQVNDFHHQVVQALSNYSPPKRARQRSSSPSASCMSPRSALFKANSRLGLSKSGRFEFGSTSRRAKTRPGLFKTITDWACKGGIDVNPFQLSSSSDSDNDRSASSTAAGNLQAGSALGQPRPKI